MFKSFEVFTLEFKLQLFTYYLDYTKRLIKLVEGMRNGTKDAIDVTNHVQNHTASNFTDVDVSFFLTKSIVTLIFISVLATSC